MNKAKLARLIGVALTFSSVSAAAGVEYNDQSLHRSDDLVRFDRAYRAGLQDGTTTIIYSNNDGPGSVPEGFEKHSNDQQRMGRSEQRPAAEKRYAATDNDPSYQSKSYQNDDQYDVPEKMQDPSLAEKRRYPTRSDQYSEDQLSDDCNCESGKSTAPRSEPVTPSKTAEPRTEPTMREKIEAVRQARELLRKSRQKGVDPEVAEIDAGSTSEDDKYGSETPRLMENAQAPSAEEAPLTPYELDPDYVRNQEVSIDVGAATIEEIASRIMPRGWRVRLSTSDQDAHEAKYEFVSSDPREVALRKLLLGTGLGYKMFFDLKNDHGKPSPLLVISEVNS